MKLDPQKQETIDIAIQEIKENFPSLQGIYLYGSFGTEYESKKSDLDLAILCEKSCSQRNTWEVAQNIAAKVNRDVDLVDLHRASTVFRFQIYSTGQRIFCNNEKYCDQFENVSISMYLRLNEERKEILDHYRREA